MTAIPTYISLDQLICGDINENNKRYSDLYQPIVVSRGIGWEGLFGLSKKVMYSLKWMVHQSQKGYKKLKGAEPEQLSELGGGAQDRLPTSRSPKTISIDSNGKGRVEPWDSEVHRSDWILLGTELISIPV